jgi:hypothetical protein
VPNTGISAGSGNYIQNTSAQQASSNFNISGNGTAGGTLSGNLVNATTQYNLNGSRILSNLGMNNLFVGTGAGAVNTGFDNAFFGRNAGFNNTTGALNAFFGSDAGISNTAGFANTFFGSAAGAANLTGSENAFFGDLAGLGHVNGKRNTFVGRATKVVGESMSPEETTLLGYNAAVQTGLIFNPKNATAIGANARVDNSNSLVLGSINGINGATADTNVGIGTTAPTAKLSVIAIGNGARVLHLGTERSWVFKQLGTGAETALELTGNDPNNNNKNFVITTQGNVGIGTTAPTATLSVNGTANKPGGGSWAVFSDERLKKIRGRFTPGLNALMQLQPLRYEYKRDNALNLKSEGEYVGFSAQAMQEIIPEAVTTTDSGYLLVNNDPIMWTMLNAIKEQQAQIQKQQELINQQQKQIAGLKKVVCRPHRRAAACK